MKNATIENSLFDTSFLNVVALSSNTSGNKYFTSCDFYSGTSAAVTVSDTISMIDCQVDSTNASAVISGSGTLKFGNLVFSNIGSIISTSTQTPLIVSNNAFEVVRPAAYPYTVKAQDEVISVDTSGAAPTVNLPASPVQGQKHTVKDRSANAAASNITVSGNGHNIVGTTSAATQVIVLNGASVTYVFDQTLWLAI